MKKHLISIMAMAMCVVAMVSCNKDDDSIGQEDSEVSLTLEQQQSLFTQSVNQFAESVDFSGVKPAYDFIMSLHEDMFIFQNENILNSLMQDPTFRKNYLDFREQLDNDSVSRADFSKLYFKAEFSTTDTLVDETLRMIVPKLEKLTPNNDCAQLIMKVQGHSIELKLDGSEKSTTVEVNSTIIDGKGHPLESENNMYIFPQRIKASVCFDGQQLFLLDENLDTDLKINVDETFDESGDSEENISFYLTKFNLDANGQIADMKFNASANYDGQKGIEAMVRSVMDNIELYNGTFTLDASIADLISDPTAEALLAWVLNSEKLRSIGTRMSIMDSNVTFEGQIRNPMEDSKFQSAIAALMVSDTITEELSMKLLEAAAPYIKADLFFKGYGKPQASMSFMYSDSLKFKKIADKILNRSMAINNPIISKMANTAATFTGVAAGYVDNMGFCPAITIYNSVSSVNFKDYFGGIDFQSGAMLIYKKFSDAFSQLEEIFRSLFETEDSERLIYRYKNSF